MSATYCTRCGTELIYSEYGGKRYDAYTGQPERYGQWSCPNLKRRRLLGVNGHSWYTHRISSLSRRIP